MLRLSKKSDYAVFLLAQLAKREAAARPDGRPAATSAAELAEESGLGRSLVANLLKEYGKAGLLESVRGPNGGYRLARPADEISLREILSVVEGPINFVACADGGLPGTAFDGCDLSSICPSRGPLQVLHNRIVSLLEDLPLSELAKTLPAPATAAAEQTPSEENRP